MQNKNLVIIAHPDDETIWMGGTILKKSEEDWTILSLCRKDDSDRMPKFIKVCEFYGARPIISDLEDEKLNPLSIKDIKEKIISLLKEYSFSFIYTHGENGEYGHIRHKEIHEAVKELVKEKKLNSEKLFFFNYIPGNESARHNKNLKIPIANEKSDVIFKLDEKTHMKKINLINEIYGFDDGSFEAKSCGISEGFKISR